ncbi:Mediator of RNA polymerase II transcription subunit 15a [Raphanus sativus]|nr:Mediator of RNA polymerase II transcription subunit 15a [Raphanus sativus]
MENNYWTPSLPKGEPAMDTGDWRLHLPPDSREKIINKIVETLKNHLPNSGPEGINELRRIAARFEGKILSGAANPSDYLRKISIKMLTMETREKSAAGSSSLTFPGAYNTLPVNPGEPAMDTQDWKTQLPAGSRQKIVNKIMETLHKHLPFPGPEGMNELRRIASRFEERIFSDAVSQICEWQNGHRHEDMIFKAVAILLTFGKYP